MLQSLSFAKSMLLPAYYYGTWVGRRFGRELMARSGNMPIAILFYHRVADHTLNPWTISNTEFLRQVNWLVENFDVISLSEVQRRIASGTNDRPAVCLTFDDGYAENCEQALPLLISRRIPFTYFVATNFVLKKEPFPHDVARGEPLRPNSVAELRSLAAAGVEIGAHTRSHADLGRITDVNQLRDEIVGSREDLEQMLGKPIKYFAFPYGQHQNMNGEAVRIAADAGFAGICSAFGGYNVPGRDAFHLKRIHGDPNFLRLKNWLSLDPRLLAREWHS